jgi:hypothetical protein
MPCKVYPITGTPNSSPRGRNARRSLLQVNGFRRERQRSDVRSAAFGSLRAQRSGRTLPPAATFSSAFSRRFSHSTLSTRPALQAVHHRLSFGRRDVAAPDGSRYPVRSPVQVFDRLDARQIHLDVCVSASRTDTRCAWRFDPASPGLCTCAPTVRHTRPADVALGTSTYCDFLWAVRVDDLAKPAMGFERLFHRPPGGIVAQPALRSARATRI